MPSQIYCLKCDIRKYFNSVDHVVLLCLLRKQILDPRVLRLCELIVRSVSSGIPIGNLTSQLFANIYLNELDHYVKRTLHEKQYIRYMDDFVILSNDKKRLHVDKKLIEEFLHTILKLELHPKKSDIFLIERGIDFLGYRVFPHYLTLRKSTVKRRKQKFKELAWSYKQGNISNSTSFRIGNDYSVYYFNGLIDDVRIYNKALSPAEVLTIYNSTK
ncbi:MAG: RNA-directed DNA polymerase [Candidatus Aquicultor sp.]